MIQSIFSFLRRGLQIRRNFSTTCTTLGTRGEKLQVDAALCTRGERPKKGADAQPCVSDVYKNSTRAKRRQADVPLCGRSMVEMLGVLAIIGVLSVGAIAGYSKAMLKYKLNRQAESFNLFLNNAIQIKPELERAFTGSQINADIFYKLNLIPDGMTYDSQNVTIYDIFNTPMNISYHNAGNGNIDYFISIIFTRANNKISRDSSEICHNIITTSKVNAANLRLLSMRSGNNDNTYSATQLYGDESCNSSKKTCLRNLDLKQINEICSSCESETYCSLIIYLMIKEIQ